MNSIKFAPFKQTVSSLLVTTYLCTTMLYGAEARAAADVSAVSATSGLSLAFEVVVSGASAGASVGAAASAAVAIPAALAVSGAVLIVKTIEVSARGTFFVLERASDGAVVSLQVSGRLGESVVIGVGTEVVVTVISTGAVLSAAGQAFTFFPNATGRNLLHNERVTY